MGKRHKVFRPQVVSGRGAGPRNRKKRPRFRLPPLTIGQILAWADAHKERTGTWPTATSGRVYQEPFQTWGAVNQALRNGHRGLPGGSSLARLLTERRGVRNRLALPNLKIEQILAWADEHHQGTGRWPNAESGPVEGSCGETWPGIEVNLRFGCRGLAGGSSLAKLLAKYRKVRNIGALPPLSVEQILDWADDHHRRTGRWPNVRSGLVKGGTGETWSAIGNALVHGGRGFPGGYSLARLLVEHRGVHNRADLPRLTIAQVLRWADAHRERTGRWPHGRLGAVEDAPGETWHGIDVALKGGGRGMRGGASLSRLLHKHRHVPKGMRSRPMTVKQILELAGDYHQQTGTWPNHYSGPVPSIPDTTWSRINSALRYGSRGLPGGTTLRQLLVNRGRIKET